MSYGIAVLIVVGGIIAYLVANGTDLFGSLEQATPFFAYVLQTLMIAVTLKMCIRDSNKINKRYEMHWLDYSEPVEVPYLSGCFMFTRMAILERVGGFDER